MINSGSKKLNYFRNSDCKSNLRFGLLFAVSTVWVSSTPTAQDRQPRKSLSLPRNYCAADVTSLGTGLVRVPVQFRTKSLPHKSIKWSGWLRAAASGKYEVSLPGNDVHIFVNHRRIFTRSAMSLKPTVIQIDLLANRFYAISVETPNSGNSDLQLRWRRPDGRHEEIPKAYLYAPLATAIDSEAA